jgi:hypothetical protein
MKQKTITWVFILGALAFSSIFFFNNNSTGKEDTLPVSINGRIFSDTDSMIFINQIDVVGQIIRLYSLEDNLWAVDASNNRINQYNTEGQLVRQFSKAGDAPWENSSIWYFDKIEDGYFVLDRPKKMIKKFDENDTLSFYYKSQDYIDNCVHIAGNLFLFSEENVEKFDFVTIDIKTGKEVNRKSTNELLTSVYGTFPEKNLGLVLEGNYSRSSNGSALYYFYKFGYFLVFDSAGNIRYGARTIDNFEMPKPVSKKLSPGVFEETVEPDYFVNYSACMDNQFIYILSNVLKSSYKDNRVIDIYSTDNGKYIKSLLVQNLDDGQKPIEICKAENNTLTVLYEDMAIVNYEIRK